MKDRSAYIIGAAKTEDGVGSLNQVLLLESKLLAKGLKPQQLIIDPLQVDWHSPEAKYHFRSGCAPIEALAKAKQLIENGSPAVIIAGEDHIKTAYNRAQRLEKMAVYGQEYPLTQAYTDLARTFSENNGISAQQFKSIANALFENYITSYKKTMAEQFHPELLPESRWYNSITELFRGVDCANPMVDFSGKLIITSADIAEQLDVDKSQWLKVSAVELGRLEGDGAHYIDEIARYQHLHQAYHQACNQAKIDFAHLFKNGEALLEAYTCYPVVPMAFLLVSGLIDTLDEMSSFLAKHTITVTGGMNLARAAWNNPALNALIVMHQRLTNDKESVGLVHGNGGLGYRQGVAIIERVT